MNNGLKNFFFVLLSVLLSTPCLHADDKEQSRYVTMGDIKFPVVAEADDMAIVKMGSMYTGLKIKDKGSEYETCGLSEAQSTLLKKPLEAAAVYEKCLEERPNDYRLLRAIGIAYMVAKDFNKSISGFEKAVRLNPEDGVLNEQLADAYAAQGNMEEANKHYATAKKYMRRLEAERLTKKLNRIEGFGFDNVIASYLLDFKGLQIRNGLVTSLLYRDPVRNQEIEGDRKVYYSTQSDDGNDAVIDLSRLYKTVSAMKELNREITEDRAAAQTQEREDEARIDELKKKIKKDNDDTGLREELADAQRALIDKLVKREGSYILARTVVQKEVEAQIAKAAEQAAKARGIGRITEKMPEETAIDLSVIVGELINESYQLEREDITALIEKARNNVQVRDDIDADEFFAAKPIKADKKTRTSADDHAQTARSGVSAAKPAAKSGSDAASQMPENKWFVDHGFALEIDRGLISWEALGRKNIFYEDDGMILWFGQLSNWGKVKDAWTRGRYPIEWTAPDGRVFLKEIMSPTMTRFQDLIYSQLSLAQFKDIPKGEWQVKVWRKDDLIYEAKFEIN